MQSNNVKRKSKPKRVTAVQKAMNGKTFGAPVAPSILANQVFQVLDDLGHCRAFLMFMGPHMFYESNDLRTPLLFQASDRWPKNMMNYRMVKR